jgi:hypothetical protein
VGADHRTQARALDMTLDEFLIEAGDAGLYAIDHDVEHFKRELNSIMQDARWAE